MKRTFLLFLLPLCMFAGCRHDDRVVAEVHNHKLYASEVGQLVPAGLSRADSADFAQHVIDDWIMEQVILAEAEKTLTVGEKVFDKELEEYRKTLLKNRYFEKITADAEKFKVSDEEVRAAIRQTKVNLVSDKEIVKINYVKLPRHAAVRDELKEILFDDARRITEKERIAELCSDSIEYFITDDQWLFWEDIQLETGITLDKNSQRLDFPLTFEKVVNEDEYLIVILDFRAETTGDESKDYFESVRTMLIQQKKNQFIQKRMKELYQEAEKKGKINQ
ncbi:MAG: hypothetical protein IKN98_00610 [Bacteroidales bacterium]|nr:hypothetical protein [Bacteroidales bacterium]